MSSRFVTLLVLASSLICASVLSAQVMGGGSGVGSGSFRMHGIEGNPFSADVINLHTNVLADGNRIDQETHGKMYRDSQGKTRNEIELPLPTGEKHLHISIFDPVQQVSIFIDPIRKTAQIHHLGNPPGSLSVPPHPAPAQPQERSQMTHSRENLGHTMIEGFDAIGNRFTNTTVANAIGNAQPLVNVMESWRSTELNVDLLSKSSDPQRGENVRKLVNIQRSEPDPALFQVPPDYAVTDMPAPH